MAFGLKYRAQYKQHGTGLVKEIRISREGYAGSVIEWETANDMPVNYRKGDDGAIFSDPIKPTVATLQFKIDYQLEVTEFLEDRQLYRAEVVDVASSQTEFVGWIEPYNGGKPYGKAPHYVTLTAACGLSQLKKIRYAPATSAAIRTQIQVLTDCLNLTGNTLTIHAGIYTREANMPTPARTLEWVKENTARFFSQEGERDFCYPILADILDKYNAEIVQENGAWYIRPIPAQILGQANMDTYVGGVYVESFAMPLTHTVNNVAVLSLEGGQITALAPVKKHTAEVDFTPMLSGGDNLDIKKMTGGLPDGWTKAGFSAGYSGVVATPPAKNYFQLTGSIPHEGGAIDISRNFWGKYKLKPKAQGDYIASPYIPFEMQTSKVSIEGKYETSPRAGNEWPHLVIIGVRAIKADGSAQTWLKPDGTWDPAFSFLEFEPATSGTSRSGVKSSGGSYKVDIDTEVLNASYIRRRPGADGGTPIYIPYDRLQVQFYRIVTRGDTFYPNAWVKHFGFSTSIERPNAFARYNLTIKDGSSKVEDDADTVNLMTGDGLSYMSGTLLQNDGVTPTGVWKRFNKTEGVSLLRTMLADRLAITYQPSQVVECEIAALPTGAGAGYLPFLIFADLGADLYKILRYEYDDMRRIATVTAAQVRYGEPLIEQTAKTNDAEPVTKSGRILADEENTGELILPDSEGSGAVKSGRQSVEDLVDDVAEYGSATHTPNFVLLEDGTIRLVSEVLIQPEWDDVQNTPDILSAAQVHLQSGNAFGAPALIGTTDNQPVQIITNNTARVTIAANGAVSVAGSVQAFDANGSARYYGKSGPTGNPIAALLVGNGFGGSQTLDIGGGTTQAEPVTAIRFRVGTAGSLGTGALVGQWGSTLLTVNTPIQSTVPDGTAPLQVASITRVTNLNADLLDGQHGAFYQDASNLNAGTLPIERHPTSGVTAATYRSVTVDAYGHVTAGTNPAELTPGTANYVQKSTGTALADSQIFDDGTVVGVGTASVPAGFKTNLAGNTRFTTTAGAGSIEAYGVSSVKLKSTATLGLESAAGSNINLQPGGVHKGVITPDGGLGVNRTTVTAGYRLDVNGNAQVFNDTATTETHGGGTRRFTKMAVGAPGSDVKNEILLDNYYDFFRLRFISAARGWHGTEPAILTTDANGGQAAPFNSYGRLLIVGRAENSTNGDVEIVTGADRRRAQFTWEGDIKAFRYLSSAQTAYSTPQLTGGRVAILDGDGYVKASRAIETIAATDAAAVITGAWQFSTNPTITGTPSGANDLVSKSWVESQVTAAAGGMLPGYSVNGVAVTNLTLSGIQNINGTVGAAGKKMLLIAQTDPAQNGIWVMASGAWTRSPYHDTASEISYRTHYVSEGNFINSTYVNTNSSSAVIGTTPLIYTLLTGGELDPTVPAWVKAITSEQAANLAYMVRTNATYANPGWITALAASKLTGADEILSLNNVAALSPTGVPFKQDGTWSITGGIPQSQHATLTALINNGAAGYLTRKGDGTYASRTYQAGTGIDITYPAGQEGNTVWSLSPTGVAPVTSGPYQFDGFGRLVAKRAIDFTLDIINIPEILGGSDKRPPTFAFATLTAVAGSSFAFTVDLTAAKTSYHAMSDITITRITATSGAINWNYDTTTKLLSLNGTLPAVGSFSVNIEAKDNLNNAGGGQVPIVVVPPGGSGEITACPVRPVLAALYGFSKVHEIGRLTARFGWSGPALGSIGSLRWKTFTESDSGGTLGDVVVQANSYTSANREGDSTQFITLFNPSVHFANYTVNVSRAGTFKLNFFHACANSTNAITYQVNGGSVVTKTLSNSGGWDNFVTSSDSDITLSAGANTIRLMGGNSSVKIQYFTLKYPPGGGGTTRTLFDTGTVAGNTDRPLVSFTREHSPGINYIFEIQGETCTSTPDETAMVVPEDGYTLRAELWNNDGSGLNGKVTDITPGGSYEMPAAGWEVVMVIGGIEHNNYSTRLEQRQPDGSYQLRYGDGGVQVGSSTTTGSYQLFGSGNNISRSVSGNPIADGNFRYTFTPYQGGLKQREYTIDFTLTKTIVEGTPSSAAYFYDDTNNAVRGQITTGQSFGLPASWDVQYTMNHTDADRVEFILSKAGTTGNVFANGSAVTPFAPTTCYLFNPGQLSDSSNLDFENPVPLREGSYTLQVALRKNNTVFRTDTYSFTITAPGSTQGERKELFLNMTGFGWDSTTASGIHSDWTPRIEAFNYSWGWGITGIRVALRWSEWEPTAGNYDYATLGKIKAYAAARGLKLSFFITPWRKDGDGFIATHERMTGNGGTVVYEGVPGFGQVQPSLAATAVRARFNTAVQALSAGLSDYEGGYYIAMGMAGAEEMANPIINPGKNNQELTGFEQIMQDDFARWLALKGKAYSRPVVVNVSYPTPQDPNRGNGYLDFGDDNSREFARYVSLLITRAFDGFAAAVWNGSLGRVRPCYEFADDGSQTGWHLATSWTMQARGLFGRNGILYGTEGTNQSNVYKKQLVNAINLGISQQGGYNLVSAVEYDPEDLGQNPPAYGTGINYTLLDTELRKSYTQGVQLISFAMAFSPAEIAGMSSALQGLFNDHVGKAYTRPSAPLTTVDVAQVYFGGVSVESAWTGKNGGPQNHLAFNDTNFYGALRTLYVGEDPPDGGGSGSAAEGVKSFTSGGRIFEIIDSKYFTARIENNKLYDDGPGSLNGKPAWYFDGTRAMQTSEMSSGLSLATDGVYNITKRFIATSVGSSIEDIINNRSQFLVASASEGTSDCIVGVYPIET